jgi:hypothetical protein
VAGRGSWRLRAERVHGGADLVLILVWAARDEAVAGERRWRVADANAGLFGMFAPVRAALDASLEPCAGAGFIAFILLTNWRLALQLGDSSRGRARVGLGRRQYLWLPPRRDVNDAFLAVTRPTTSRASTTTR